MIDDVEQGGHEYGGHAGHEEGEGHEARAADGDDADEPLGLMHGSGQTGEDHHGQTFEEEGNGDGADERGNARSVAQGAVGDFVHEDAEGGGTQNGHHHGRGPGQTEERGAVEDEVRAEHEDVAVGEVDEAQDAVHHGVADGDEAVQRTERQRVEKVLEE